MPRFRPLAGRAHWAKRALITAVLLAVGALIADIQQWRLTKRIVTGEATLAEVEANETIQTVVVFAQFGAFIVAAILFLCWFHRAYANLRPLGAEGLPHGPGWAVGYWFIPIINLVRPATVASDIWRASDPGEEPTAWRQRKRPGLVVLWWLTFLLAAFLTRYSSGCLCDAQDAGDLTRAAGMLIVADAFTITAGVLAVLFVRRTTARQETRASFLQTPLPGVAPQAS